MGGSTRGADHAARVGLISPYASVDHVEGSRREPLNLATGETRGRVVPENAVRPGGADRNEIGVYGMSRDAGAIGR